MEKLKVELVKLETELSDPALFVRDPSKFEKTSLRHKQAADELADSENQWLELEMLREELEG